MPSRWVLLKKSAESVSAVLAPKVRGTWNLDQASAEADLDVFVLFSSGVAVFGNVGQADYAAANGFLDIFAAYRDGLVAQGLRHGRSLAIDWPLWDAGGMRLFGVCLQNIKGDPIGPPAESGQEAIAP